MSFSKRNTLERDGRNQVEEITENCIKLAVIAERESFIKHLELSPDEIRLMAGEMTSQEMRTVLAVLGGIASRVRFNV